MASLFTDIDWMPIMEELRNLLDKIKITEEMLERAEEFMAEHKHNWSDGFIIHFEKYLENKRELLYYEQALAEKLAWKVALEPYQPDFDI